MGEEEEAQAKDIETFGDEESAPEPDEPQADDDTPPNSAIPEELL